MTTLLAATPLVVILVGMAIMHLPATKAGLVGLLVALGLALTFFRGDAAGDLVWLFQGTGAEALHSTATILWIILPALAIFEFQKRVGAIERIRDTLASLTTDQRLQAILIAWFFGLFMEGAAGFGTPVALAAPLLVGMGYSPVRAVVLALLGHAAGVSFGAVGTPALAQLAFTDVAPSELALKTAALHALAAPILLVLMVRLAAPQKLSRGDIQWAFIALLCFIVPFLGLAAMTGPEIATLGGALIGSAAFVLLLRRKYPGPKLDLRGLVPDLAPYLAILLLVLVTRLVPPLQAVLSGISLNWSLHDSFGGVFQPLYHPGTMLFLGLAIGAFLTGRTAALPGAIKAALRRLVMVAIALLIMLILSRLMVHSGMIATLAATAANTGPFWPLIAPMVGILGTFITGSATASNILFTELQLSTAQSLSLPSSWFVAVQNFGAAIGNIVAPHNIIAGSATVGLVGREGAILRQTVWPCLLYALVGGCVVFVLAHVI